MARINRNSTQSSENISALTKTLIPQSVIKLTILSLIFLSIIPYASSYSWVEAMFCFIIFGLGVINIFQKRSPYLTKEYFRLLLPLVILAFYSFFQGLISLLIQESIINPSLILPVSYDLTSSFWSSVKIFAFVYLIKLLLDYFKTSNKLLVLGLVLIGNFFALAGIFRFLLQNRFPDLFEYFLFPQLTPGIGFGTYINQNHFAYLMLMTIGLNICLLWWGKFSKHSLYLLVIFSLLSWTALILTGSRGGIISSFAIVAFVIFVPGKKGIIENPIDPTKSGRFKKGFFSIKKLAVFSIISTILVFGILYIGNDRVVKRFEKLPLQMKEVPANTTFLRKDVYRATFEIIKENPIFGVGFGGFKYAVSKHIDIAGNIVPEQTHNDYLEYLSSGGLIALCFAIWFIYIFISVIRKNLRESYDYFSYAARMGAISGIVGVSIHNLFDFSLQIFANLIFFAALITIAIHSDQEDTANSDSQNNDSRKNNILKIFSFILLSILTIYTAVFGYSRYSIATTDLSVATKLPILPFDSEAFEKQAIINRKINDNWEALFNLNNAIKYKPYDYSLWINLGKLQQEENQEKSADKSFQQAIYLAPYYSSPKFHYGKFLIENKKQREGFEYLAQALHGNLKYFNEVLDIIWKETGENGIKTYKVLAPLTINELDLFVLFLLEKNEYSTAVDTVCEHNDFPPDQRRILVQKLLEKRKYYLADKVFTNNCSNSSEKKTEFKDGDFSKNEIDDGIGFGWRINNLPDQVKVNVKNEEAKKTSSLQVFYNGHYNPVLPIITQLLIVEKNQKYILKFSYQKNELVTGGLPVIHIVPKKEKSDGNLFEVPLSNEKSGWVKESIEFETDDTTEAVEIRLVRNPCEQKLCPIFGSLQLTDFEIQKQ